MPVLNKKIAVLVTDGFEQVELTGPVEALRRAGAEVSIVSPKTGKIQGMNHDEVGDQLSVDHNLASVSANRFDALLLPGGVANPDTLRTNPQAVAFVRHFVETNKPIAAICHGPWTLIEADGVRGHRMTSWPSLRTDLKNAGADWEDRSVVVDGNLVSARTWHDNAPLMREFMRMLNAA